MNGCPLNRGFTVIAIRVKGYMMFSFFFRFVDTCMELMNQGMNKEEAIENTVKTLFTGNTTTIPVSEILLTYRLSWDLLALKTQY